MSQEIVADIVRRALAPEPVGEDGRPRETPLEERLRLLHNALGGTQQRVSEQQQKLEKLRAELDEYRALMERVKQKAVEAQRAAEQLPAPMPAPAKAEDIGCVAEIPAPQPSEAGFPALPLSQALAPLGFQPMAEISSPRPLEDALTPRLSWRQFVPYVAIALFGAGMSYMVTRRPAPPALPTLRAAAVPPPSLTADAPAAAADKTAAGEDVSNAEILSLISSFVPPRGKRTVADILGPEMDDPQTDSPWTLMRVDAHTILVSFHPYGDVIDNAPVYEFTVDPVAKTVTASDETLANLRGGAVAAAR